MDTDRILHTLLEIGREGRFSEIGGIAELSDHVSVLRLADVHRDKVISFATELAMPDRIAFAKSVAIVENRVGGLGSVTMLERLLSLILDPERKLLDWILRNTTSYWYYAYGARSIEEFDLACRRKAERAAESIRRDEDRQAQDRSRIAKAATRKLYNAVRRGDIKAVRALIEKGADVSVPAPNGSSVLALATSRGFEAIATELRNAGTK